LEWRGEIREHVENITASEFALVQVAKGAIFKIGPGYKEILTKKVKDRLHAKRKQTSLSNMKQKLLISEKTNAPRMIHCPFGDLAP